MPNDTPSPMTGQSDAAAERSAHVTREAVLPASDPFVGPEFGPLRLRAIVELEAEVARLRAALAFYAEADNWRALAAGEWPRTWADEGSRARAALGEPPA